MKIFRQKSCKSPYKPIKIPIKVNVTLDPIRESDV